MKIKLLPIILFMFFSSMSYAGVITIKVTTDENTATCYIAGTFNNWDPTANEMTRLSDNPRVYTIDLEIADGDLATTEYKFLSGPDFKYEQTESDNWLYSEMPETGNVVASFKAYYDLGYAKDVTIDVLVPNDVLVCYITGNFNGWNSMSDEMTLVNTSTNGKEFTYTFYCLDTTVLEYKFLAGPGWPYEQSNAANYVYMNDLGVVVCDQFKDYYNPEEVGDITINVTVPEGTVEVWIVGSFNNWDMGTALQATKNSDGTFTGIIDDVAEIEYKIWCHNDWDYEESIDAEGTSRTSNRTASYIEGPEFNIVVEYWKLLWSDNVSIKDLYKNIDYKAYSRYNEIIVEDVVSGVSVFDLSGRMIQSSKVSGTFVSKPLPIGVYILKIDKQTQKLLVK